MGHSYKERQNLFSRYESFVNKTTMTHVIIFGVLLAVAITFGIIAPDLNVYIINAIALIGGGSLFLLSAHFLAPRHSTLDYFSLTPWKGKYSFSRRQQFSVYAIVVLILMMVLIQGRVPYVVGGVLFAFVGAHIFDFVRPTEQERLLSSQGIVDVRDTENLTTKAQQPKETIPPDFQWGKQSDIRPNSSSSEVK